MNGSNLLVVQGGGPTQVLNATLVAIIEEARASGRFGKVFGARNGTKGLVAGRVFDLAQLSSSELALLRVSPGACLGSSRLKPEREEFERILENLILLKVEDLLFVGGNGSMYGAQEVAGYCRRSGYPIRVLGIPKTVDNDIAVTDRCPGYASAARYVAQSTRDLGMDLRALPQPISILETMGRSVGWLAAASALSKQDQQDAPHLVYLPELPFDLARFIAAVEDTVGEYGWAVVVVSEGIRDATGRPVYQKQDPAMADPLKRPVPGGVGQYLADEVANQLKLRCRCEKPGLLGRASSRHVSPQDLQDAELVGRAGVRGLLDGRTDEMAALVPLKDDDSVGYRFVSLDKVSGIERSIPAEWIEESPIPVNARFLEYLRPLTGELVPYHVPITAEFDFDGVA
jgi:6-phosphofructokinase